MLAFHWEIIDSILNNFQGVLQTIMVAPLLFYKKNWFLKQIMEKGDMICQIFHQSGLLFLQINIHQLRINIQHYMLPHPILSQHYNALIQISRSWKKYPTYYFSFPLRKHLFKSKEVSRDILTDHVSTFVLLQFFWFLKNRLNVADIICQLLRYCLPFKKEVNVYQTLYVIVSTIVGCYFRILLFINEG